MIFSYFQLCLGRAEHGASTQGIVSLAGGTTVHFKLDTSTGQLKLKVKNQF